LNRYVLIIDFFIVVVGIRIFCDVDGSEAYMLNGIVKIIRVWGTLVLIKAISEVDDPNVLKSASLYVTI